MMSLVCLQRTGRSIYATAVHLVDRMAVLCQQSFSILLGELRVGLNASEYDLLMRNLKPSWVRHPIPFTFLLCVLPEDFSPPGAIATEFSRLPLERAPERTDRLCKEVLTSVACYEKLHKAYRHLSLETRSALHGDDLSSHPAEFFSSCEWRKLSESDSVKDKGRLVNVVDASLACHGRQDVSRWSFMPNGPTRPLSKSCRSSYFLMRYTSNLISLRRSPECQCGCLESISRRVWTISPSPHSQNVKAPAKVSVLRRKKKRQKDVNLLFRTQQYEASMTSSYCCLQLPTYNVSAL